MLKVKYFAFILLVFYLSSCANNIVRTNYSLTQIGPYLVSNSQTNPYILDKDSQEKAHFTYSLILKNIESKTLKLNPTNNSYIEIDKQIKKIDCQILGNKTIAFQEQGRIDCKINITLEDFPILKDKDSFAKITISLDDNYSFYGDYKISVEDFE